MTIFDLLFLLILLVSAAALIAAAVLAISGRAGRALRILRVWAIGAAVYVAIAIGVSIALPIKTFQLGEEQCEDDWCLTVESARRSAPDTCEVTLLLASHALRVTQRNNNGLVVFLTDDRGARYPAIDEPSAVPFNVKLAPGQSVTTMRHFKVPAGADELNLIVGHQGFSPGWLIIGREPFEKTAVRLGIQ